MRTIGIGGRQYGEVARLSADEGLNLSETLNVLVGEALAARAGAGVSPASGSGPASAVQAGPTPDEVESDDARGGNGDDFWPTGKDGISSEGDVDDEDNPDDGLVDLAARLGELEERADDADEDRRVFGVTSLALAAGLDDHLAQHEAGEVHAVATRQLVLRVLEAGGVPELALESAERMVAEGRWPDDPADAVALARAWVDRTPAIEAAAAEAGGEDASDGDETEDADGDESKPALVEEASDGAAGGGGLVLAGAAVLAGLLLMRPGAAKFQAQTSATPVDPLEQLVRNA